MAIDKIPHDMDCECEHNRAKGPVFNVVRQYEDPTDTTINMMKTKYEGAFDVLKKGIKVFLLLADELINTYALFIQANVVSVRNDTGSWIISERGKIVNRKFFFNLFIFGNIIRWVHEWQDCCEYNSVRWNIL